MQRIANPSRAVRLRSAPPSIYKALEVIQELFYFPQKYVFSAIRKSRELLTTSWGIVSSLLSSSSTAIADQPISISWLCKWNDISNTYVVVSTGSLMFIARSTFRNCIESRRRTWRESFILSEEITSIL